MTEPTLGANGGQRGGMIGPVGRLVGFVGGLAGSGGSVDMGLGPFIQFGHCRDLYKSRDKPEAGGLPRGFAGPAVLPAAVQTRHERRPQQLRCQNIAVAMGVLLMNGLPPPPYRLPLNTLPQSGEGRAGQREATLFGKSGDKQTHRDTIERIKIATAPAKVQELLRLVPQISPHR